MFHGAEFRNDDVLDGLYPGIVTSSADPLNIGRIKVRYPWMHDEEESHWARVVRPYAGKERGWFFIPEVGDEVLVCFELGDINQPLVVGSSWNGEDPPPEPGDPDGENHAKVVKTRSKHRFAFHDEPGEESIMITDASGQNTIRWDSKTNNISITALTGDIYVKAPQGKISILAKDVRMKVTNNAKRTVGGNEQTTVAKSAIEGEGNSKTWSANTSLTGTAKTVAITASSSMGISGSSAGVECKQQGDSDKIAIGGSTTDTVGELTLKSKTVAEKAASRTWNIGKVDIKADNSAALDASGPLTMTGLFNADIGGQFSLLGDMINVQAGTIKMVAQHVDFNPKSPPAANPGALGVIVDAASVGTGL